MVPKGDIIATTVDMKASTLVSDSVCLWNAATGKEIVRFDCDRPNSLSFSPDGSQLVAAMKDSTVRVWSVPMVLKEKCFVDTLNGSFKSHSLRMDQELHQQVVAVS